MILAAEGQKYDCVRGRLQGMSVDRGDGNERIEGWIRKRPRKLSGQALGFASIIETSPTDIEWNVDLKMSGFWNVHSHV